MGYRMIIADDEEMLIRLIRKLGHFEELGVEVVDECRNGEDAYNSIVKNHPDFVLTDIQMPVLDGLELIDKVCQTNADILFPPLPMPSTGAITLRWISDPNIIG